MSAFAPDALTDALAEESVSQTRACAAALGDGSGIISSFADWRKTGAIAAILANSLRGGMHTFPLTPGSSPPQVCQQMTLERMTLRTGISLTRWRKSDAFYFGLEPSDHPVWLCERGYGASLTPAARLRPRFGFCLRATWAAEWL